MFGLFKHIYAHYSLEVNYSIIIIPLRCENIEYKAATAFGLACPCFSVSILYSAVSGANWRIISLKGGREKRERERNENREKGRTERISEISRDMIYRYILYDRWIDE